MKKNFKLVLALVLAAMMIVSMIPTLADTGDLGINGNGVLTVSGLDAGDTVAYYQVLAWGPSQATPTDGINDANGNPIGWVKGDGISEITETDLLAIVGTNDGSGVINHDVAGRIASKYVAANAHTDGTNNNGTWTTTVTEPGLYMVIVTPAKAGTLYNPIFVAANWKGNNEDADTSNTIAVSANELTYSDKAMVKKSSIPLNKKAIGTDAYNGAAVSGDTTNNFLADGAYTADAGETINFEVTTHVPKYGTNYTHPKFILTDKLTGLGLVANSVVVTKADGTALPSNSYSISSYAEDDSEYTVTFTEAYMWGNTDPAIPADGQDIKIVYSAKVNDTCEKIVNQEDNTVTLKFSTEPTDETGKGRLRDQTNHFTFSIDADLLGHGDIGGSSTEAIKVGVDKEGNPIIATSYYEWSQETHAPLAGATFKLYTNSDCADAHIYKNKWYPDGVEVVSDAAGRINIKGLDAGEYWLKEITAPAGWIKLQTAVKVTITANITEETRTVVEYETVNGVTEPVEVTYKTNELKDYTVVIGDQQTHYTITLSESSAEAISADRDVTNIVSSDKELKNTKGVELPSTGGIGTTIFYIGGSILVLAAAILLITKRRMGAED